MNKPRIKIPIVIIGDGIMGTLLARELSLSNKDNLVIGTSLDSSLKSASLANMATFQSGILQAYSYTLNDFIKDEKRRNGKTDFLRSIKKSREDLISINDKIKKFFAKQDGILHLPKYNKDKFEDHLKKVTLLGYEEKYTKKMDLSDAKKNLGNFYREESDNYTIIPDRPFEIDKVILFIKKRIINTINKTKAVDTIFSKMEKDAITIIREKNGSFSIDCFDNISVNTSFLVLCAGFYNYKILNSLNIKLINKSKLRGFCLNESKNIEDVGLKVPFFSRLERGNYLNLCKHGSKSINNLDLFISNTNNSIPLEESDKQKDFQTLKTYKETQIDSQVEDTNRVLHKNLSKENKQLKKSNHSFCIHIYGDETYSDCCEYSEEIDNLLSIHPGLATNAIKAAQDTAKKVLMKSKTLFNKLDDNNRTKLFKSFKKHHDEIKNTRYRDIKYKSWFKD